MRVLHQFNKTEKLLLGTAGTYALSKRLLFPAKDSTPSIFKKRLCEIEVEAIRNPWCTVIKLASLMAVELT